MNKDCRLSHREIIGGPSRETLFDCLRFSWPLPYLDEFCWGRIHSQRATNVPLVSVGSVYENDNETWIIKYRLAGREKPFEAFYSTNTRSGWVCRASEIKIWHRVVPAYRPITDYEVIALLQLAKISRQSNLLDHIKARIIRGINGMVYPAPEEGVLFEKAEFIKSLFGDVYKNRIKADKEAIRKFREILG